MSTKVLYETLATESGKKIGVATLNSEKSLNALSQEMIMSLIPQLTIWREDNDIAAVLLQGAGDKAFCAGGDVRQLYDALVEDRMNTASSAEFFEQEYRLDYLIHTFTKPIIVWGHGIVMGGGLGLMAGASHRIVTETSRIAMPEVTIGLYPDVAATYFLNRMPPGCGLFLGLTGAAINATDAQYIGLADFFIPYAQKDELITLLQQLNWGETVSLNHEKLNDRLREKHQQYRSQLPKGNIQQHTDLLESCMTAPNLQTVVNNIMQIDSEHKWLQQAQKTLAKGCPITAHIVSRQLTFGQSLSLSDCFRLELILSLGCVRDGDFVEGVRALLVDKDRNPQWRHKSVDDVPNELIEQIFTSPWSENKHPLHDLGVSK